MTLVETVWSDAVRQARENGSDICAGAVGQMRENAGQVSQVLHRTADVLQHSARLAVAHAERQQRAGLIDLASEEWRVAESAGQAAGRARMRAAEFGALANGISARPHERPSVSQPA